SPEGAARHGECRRPAERIRPVPRRQRPGRLPSGPAARRLRVQPLLQPGKSAPPRHMRAHRRREKLLRHQGPALPPDCQPDDLGGRPVGLLSGLVRAAARGNAYRMLLRNQKERAPVPPLTLLTSILDMEIEQSDLASAFELWTVGRRGELFNTGKDTLRSARYCYFDLRDLDGEPELMTAIVYV